MEVFHSDEFYFDANKLSAQEKNYYFIKSVSEVNIFNPTWTTGYSEIKSQLKTGDIILVHGKYQYSWVAELLQWSKWTHSAIVVRREDIDPQGVYSLPELLLWESNVDKQNVPNLSGPQSGVIKAGPMLISLEDRLNNTITYPDVQIVHRPLNDSGLKPQFENLIPYFDSVINCGFPTDIEVIHSIYLGRKFNRSSDKPLRDIQLYIDPKHSLIEVISADSSYILNTLKDHDVAKSNIYCSELVAGTYKKIGLLTNNYVSNAYTPKDLSTEGTIRLLNRSWLGEEMYIDMKK